MLVGWLMTAMDPSVRGTIAYVDSVYEMWEDLKTRFEVPDAMRFHELKEALQACKQGYRNIPHCKCWRCSCELEKQFREAVEKEKVHDFLLGLNSATYGTLRSNILSMSKLSKLSKVGREEANSDCGPESKEPECPRRPCPRRPCPRRPCPRRPRPRRPRRPPRIGFYTCSFVQPIRGFVSGPVA
ncbi:unnamed protein product, partial [Cuscuta europaea]